MTRVSAFRDAIAITLFLPCAIATPAQCPSVQLDREEGDIVSFLQVAMVAERTAIASDTLLKAKSKYTGKRASTTQHFWPRAFGRVGSYGTTLEVPPHDLSSHLAWTWHHPSGEYSTLIAGGPVIDMDNNTYIVTHDGIFKIDSSGAQSWNYSITNINNMPALMGDTLYASDTSGNAIALDIANGQERWKTNSSSNAGGDSGYPAAYDGLFIHGVDVGQDPLHPGGNTRIVAIDGTTGVHVWDYQLTTPTWNFAPIFPDDDTFVFMDFSGGLYRIGLHNGTEIWHTPAPDSDQSFSDGGAIIGTNGVAYTCSNPGTDGGGEGSSGAVRAFRISDGQMLWNQTLPQACNSYPAVGRLNGNQDLSVVVTPGNFMGSTSITGGVMAFDAATGAVQWHYEAPVYVTPSTMAVGDDTPLAINSGICLPAHWGAPIIAGDGTVYVGRSDGKLYAVRSDFSASPSVVNVETFDAHGSFLHGSTAFAPGMMAVATCTNHAIFMFRY